MIDREFYGRRRAIADVLSTVDDPELPGVSIIDLGMIIDIRSDGEHWNVDLAPTYMGCPAIDVIPVLAKSALISSGYADVQVGMILSPAWSTDWMSEEGRIKLKENQIVPPQPGTDQGIPRECPRCQSTHLALISQFGSTACKAMYVCQECKEPFEYFKCH